MAPGRSFLAAAMLASCCVLGSGAHTQAASSSAIDREFRNACASCHGEDGKGAGFLTRLFKGIDPGDLTQLSANNGGEFPYDWVLDVIDGRIEVAAHGERQMPVWGDRYTVDSLREFGDDARAEERLRARVQELAAYLKSIQEP